ncbi:MAG: DUF167 domain-containing protein [Gemmatimonadota bacterium]|nr:MAG: DUF167 domain-containing protein [Gemmatimonadota bacterium]
MIEDKGDRVRVRVRAQPRASRTEVAGAHGGAIKIRLKAAPVEGAANAELIAFFAKRLGVAKGAVSIVKGAGVRDKVVEIEGVSAEQVRAALL